MPLRQLRVASYNIRVDHTEDAGTEHVWENRRAIVAASVRGLHADLIGVQEPSSVQEAHLRRDLGEAEFGVSIPSCDPSAWLEALPAGPPAQARDGNGFVWRKDRLELLPPGVDRFWLSPSPDGHPAASRSASGEDGRPYSLAGCARQPLMPVVGLPAPKINIYNVRNLNSVPCAAAWR